MRPRLPAEDLDAIAARPFWNALDGAVVLFTGASGFFGSWLLESWLHATEIRKISGRALALTRDAVRFTQNLPHLATHPRVTLVEGGAQRFSHPPGPVDFVIHSLVPDSGTPLSQTRIFFSRVTRSLLGLARERRSRGFLLCSTGAVYEPGPTIFSEDSTRVSADGPLTYASIRRQVEDLCLEAWMQWGTPATIARGFSFSGPRLPLDAGFALGNFLRDGLAGDMVTVQGDGTAFRSYLYAADMAVWLWTILLQGRPGDACNVGSDTAISIADLARTVGGALKAEVRILHQPTSPAAPAHYIPDIHKAAHAYGLSPSTDLVSGIEKHIRWLNTSA